MTQGFDDYWKNECLGVTYDYPSESARDAYEAGQQSRQAEINEALSAVWNDKCSHTIIDILKGTNQ